jgi:hypothetical protein
VGQIPGDDDVIGSGLPDIRLQGRKNAGTVLGAAMQFPSEKSEHAFIQQVTCFNVLYAGNMRIGKMGQGNRLLGFDLD